jgi:rubrerythrin
MNRYTIREHKYDTDTPMARLQELENKVEDGVLVEVRHGKWQKVNDKYPRYVCTVCNHLFNNKNYNYCPKCGAKMKVEDKW